MLKYSIFKKEEVSEEEGETKGCLVCGFSVHRSPVFTVKTV